MNFVDDTSTQTSNLSLSINGSSVDKENTLTFDTPLIRSNNTVSIDLSGYATTSALNFKENVLTFNTPLNRSTNTISIDLSNYATTSALSSKENVLTFNSPLTRSGNTISVDLSGASVSSINVSNTTAGTLSVIYGGTGKNTLTSKQILIGNGINAISQTSNLVYDTSTNLLGINNSSPIAPLCVGSSGVVSDGYIVVGKRSANGANRHCRLGYNSVYDFVIGDYGSNNTAGTWIEQFKINYLAPSDSLVVDSTGALACNTLICNYISSVNLQLSDDCKIWCFDDYHYIHFNRPNDTLKIQEVGNIIFYISNSRTEKLRINSSGVTASGNINTTGNLQEGGVNLSSKYATITNLNTKENVLTFNSPLTRSTNTIGIDLSGYYTSSILDTSYNTLTSQISTKQGTLTFSNPFLNTSNTISLKYDSSLSLDASGNLKVVSTPLTTYTQGKILIGNGTTTINQSANLFYDTSNNRLGIGKINPLYCLDISGGDIVSTKYFGSQHDADKQSLVLIGRSDGSTDPLIETFTGMKCGVSVGGPLNEYNIYNYTYISFFTWGNSISVSREVMRINQRGYVGIGTTLPNQKLDVVGNANISGVIYEGNVTLSNKYAPLTTYTQGQVLIGNGTTTINQSSNLFYDTTNNNLGIGKTNPNFCLDVSGNEIGNCKFFGSHHDADKRTTFSIGRSDGSQVLTTLTFTGIKYIVSDGPTIGEASGGNYSYLSFFTWGFNIAYTTEWMRITSRGYVGIGTTSPTEKLEISGNAKISGTIYEGGSSLSSKYATITNLNSKENALTFNSPLTRSTNTIGIDLSGYLLSSTAASTYATITNLNSKENVLTFNTPLTRSSNTIGIDLSGYLLNSTAASTYATITNLNTKQNTLTFSNPFLNTSNTITLKYDSSTLNIDASGNLKVVGGSSQFTTNGSNIYFNTGNIGIGVTSPSSKLDILAPTGVQGANIISDATYILKLAHTNLSQGLNFSYNSIVAGGSSANQDLTLSSKGTGLILFSTNVGNFNLNATNAGITIGSGSSAIGFASTNGAYSSSAIAGDTILRSSTSKQLILQSGTGNYALKINTDNTINLGTTLTIANGNSSISTFGPNSSYSGILKVGSSNTSQHTTSTASIVSTTGNLHLDAGTASGIYLNYFNSSAPINSYGTMTHNNNMTITGNLTVNGSYNNLYLPWLFANHVNGTITINITKYFSLDTTFGAFNIAFKVVIQSSPTTILNYYYNGNITIPDTVNLWQWGYKNFTNSNLIMGTQYNSNTGDWNLILYGGELGLYGGSMYYKIFG